MSNIATSRKVEDSQVVDEVASRLVGQADGTLPDTQPDGTAEGDDGQNIAPTKKRGAYRADVGGANSIRI